MGWEMVRCVGRSIETRCETDLVSSRRITLSQRRNFRVTLKTVLSHGGSSIGSCSGVWLQNQLANQHRGGYELTC